MKLLVIQFEDTVSVLPKGTVVTVSDGTLSIEGEVMASIEMITPTLEGDYHIAPVEGE